MTKFYEDGRDAIETGKSYIGKTMSEISELERKHFEEVKPEIDGKHDEFIANGRARMLTVRRLIEWLQTQDPDACILAYEQNSDAYIEQFPELPSPDVLNVKMAKEKMREDLANWYRNTPDADTKIERDISTVFRYAQDNDVVIRFN